MSAQDTLPGIADGDVLRLPPGSNSPSPSLSSESADAAAAADSSRAASNAAAPAAAPAKSASAKSVRLARDAEAQGSAQQLYAKHRASLPPWLGEKFVPCQQKLAQRSTTPYGDKPHFEPLTVPGIYSAQWRPPACATDSCNDDELAAAMKWLRTEGQVLVDEPPALPHASTAARPEALSLALAGASHIYQTDSDLRGATVLMADGSAGVSTSFHQRKTFGKGRAQLKPMQLDAAIWAWTGASPALTERRAPPEEVKELVRTILPKRFEDVQTALIGTAGWQFANRKANLSARSYAFAGLSREHFDLHFVIDPSRYNLASAAGRPIWAQAMSWRGLFTTDEQPDAEEGWKPEERLRVREGQEWAKLVPLVTASALKPASGGRTAAPKRVEIGKEIKVPTYVPTKDATQEEIETWLGLHIRGLGVQLYVQIAAAYCASPSEADMDLAVRRVLEHPVLKLLVTTVLPRTAALFATMRAQKMPSTFEVRTENDYLTRALQAVVRSMINSVLKIDGKANHNKDAVAAVDLVFTRNRPLCQFLYLAQKEIAQRAVKFAPDLFLQTPMVTSERLECLVQRTLALKDGNDMWKLDKQVAHDEAFGLAARVNWRMPKKHSGAATDLKQDVRSKARKAADELPDAALLSALLRAPNFSKKAIDKDAFRYDCDAKVEIEFSYPAGTDAAQAEAAALAGAADADEPASDEEDAGPDEHNGLATSAAMRNNIARQLSDSAQGPLPMSGRTGADHLLALLAALQQFPHKLNNEKYLTSGWDAKRVKEWAKFYDKQVALQAAMPNNNVTQRLRKALPALVEYRRRYVQDARSHTPAKWTEMQVDGAPVPLVFHPWQLTAVHAMVVNYMKALVQGKRRKSAGEDVHRGMCLNDNVGMGKTWTAVLFFVIVTNKKFGLCPPHSHLLAVPRAVGRQWIKEATSILDISHAEAPVIVSELDAEGLKDAQRPKHVASLMAKHGCTLVRVITLTTLRRLDLFTSTEAYAGKEALVTSQCLPVSTLVIDEVHLAGQYNGRTLKQIRKHLAPGFTVGLTATPASHAFTALAHDWLQGHARAQGLRMRESDKREKREPTTEGIGALPRGTEIRPTAIDEKVGQLSATRGISVNDSELDKVAICYRDKVAVHAAQRDVHLQALHKPRRRGALAQELLHPLSDHGFTQDGNKPAFWQRALLILGELKADLFAVVPRMLRAATLVTEDHHISKQSLEAAEAAAAAYDQERTAHIVWKPKDTLSQEWELAGDTPWLLMRRKAQADAALESSRGKVQGRKPAVMALVTLRDDVHRLEQQRTVRRVTEMMQTEDKRAKKAYRFLHSAANFYDITASDAAEMDEKRARLKAKKKLTKTDKATLRKLDEHIDRALTLMEDMPEVNDGDERRIWDRMQEIPFAGRQDTQPQWDEFLAESHKDTRRHESAYAGHVASVHVGLQAETMALAAGLRAVRDKKLQKVGRETFGTEGRAEDTLHRDLAQAEKDHRKSLNSSLGPRRATDARVIVKERQERIKAGKDVAGGPFAPVDAASLPLVDHPLLREVEGLNELEGYSNLAPAARLQIAAKLDSAPPAAQAAFVAQALEDLYRTEKTPSTKAIAAVHLFKAYARAARDPDAMDVDDGPLKVNGQTQLPRPDKQDGAYKALVYATNYSPAGYLTRVFTDAGVRIYNATVSNVDAVVAQWEAEPKDAVLLITKKSSVGRNLQTASLIIATQTAAKESDDHQLLGRAWRGSGTRKVIMLKLVMDNKGDEHRLLLRMKQSAGSGIYSGQGRLRIALPHEHGTGAAAHRALEKLGLGDRPVDPKIKARQAKGDPLSQAVFEFLTAMRLCAVTVEENIEYVVWDDNDALQYCQPATGESRANVHQALKVAVAEASNDLDNQSEAAAKFKKLKRRYAERISSALEYFAKGMPLSKNYKPNRLQDIEPNSTEYQVRERDVDAAIRLAWMGLRRFALAICGGPDELIGNLRVASLSDLTAGRKAVVLRRSVPTMTEYAGVCETYIKMLYGKEFKRKGQGWKKLTQNLISAMRAASIEDEDEDNEQQQQRLAEVRERLRSKDEDFVDEVMNFHHDPKRRLGYIEALVPEGSRRDNLIRRVKAAERAARDESSKEDEDKDGGSDSNASDEQPQRPAKKPRHK